MKKITIAAGMLILYLILPLTSFALQMPDMSDSGESGIAAQAYVVINPSTGEVLAQKNPDAQWVPASLTKLVTALVFLDAKPNFNHVIVIQKSDQDLGGCSQGGACLPTKPGVAYRLRDLFYASLIASDNNATMAVARSTGLPADQFVLLMNQKAQNLGARGTHFVEPAGMDPANVITASDYAKIAAAAFQNSLIQLTDAKSTYSFKSANNKKYFHTIKNTDKLLGDDRLTVIGAKTGFLDESKHNFSALIQDQLGNNLLVVLLGSATPASQFSDARQLVALGTLNLAFAGFQSSVLGTSTPPATLKINN